MPNIPVYYLILSLLCLEINAYRFVFGPGLLPNKIVMPARYFFINMTSSNINELFKDLTVEIDGKTYSNQRCRTWVNKLSRKDGTSIVRYKVYDTCKHLIISIYHQGKHVQDSPIKIKGPIYPDHCNCPKNNFEEWLNDFGCPKMYSQIKDQLNLFDNVDMNDAVPKIINKYHKPETTSFCHYVVKKNEIYRNCYGKHVGFNMFSDNILLFLTRKVVLPDMELVINLGDWPLVKKNSEKLPVFSWCGSDDTIDLIMPTYDITESTLENMGRVSLDMLSVQGNVDKKWNEKEAKAIWRGRDSRPERLKLVDIAREHPDLFNVSLTNFFFYRDKEAQYGPKQPHISFFKFFDYKYQINVDGTVAAYRMPYLLGGGGMILKQDSPYYEHFYRDLVPWVHFVPVARDLHDLVQKVLWARDHDDEAEAISKAAQNFANKHLLPQDVICYHGVLLKEWSKRLINEITVKENMTHVPQASDEPCECKPNSYEHEEL